MQQAVQGDPEKAARAVGDLCVIYRDPIHVWLGRHGSSPEDAEDLVQGFVEWLLEKNRLRDFQRETAKFRSFLLACLRGFLSDERKKATADKRGSGVLPAELQPDEIPDTATPDPQHDLAFARAVHRRTVERLRTERYANDPKRLPFSPGFRMSIGGPL